MSAPLVSEKNRRFKDQLMCLKDAGLLSGKAKNSDSKTCDSKSEFPTEAIHTT